MARALFAWELGGDLGHARRSLAVARELRALGHETAFAFIDLAPLGATSDPSLEWFQAPVVAPNPTPNLAPLSASEILLNRGFGDPASLAGALRGWLGMFGLWKPDLLVSDYAPGAQLAARAVGLRKVAMGSGFSTPDPRDPMPSLRSWIAGDEAQLRQADARLLAGVRGAYERIDAQARTPATAGEIFRTDGRLLCTWPEIDPLGARDESEYVGPQDDSELGAVARWRGEKHPRVFAYLKVRDRRFMTILDAVRAVAGDAVVAAPGLPQPMCDALSTGPVRVFGEPLALSNLFPGADLCVCLGGPGITGRALEAGVPLALLPQQLEQFLVGRRVVSAGAGAMLAPDEPLPDLKDWLSRALASAEMRAAAEASTLRGRRRASAAERIARELER